MNFYLKIKALIQPQIKRALHNRIWTGIEPGPSALKTRLIWSTTGVPLDYQCFILFSLLKIYLYFILNIIYLQRLIFKIKKLNHWCNWYMVVSMVGNLERTLFSIILYSEWTRAICFADKLGSRVRVKNNELPELYINWILQSI